MEDHVNPDISNETLGTRVVLEGIRVAFPKVFQLSTNLLQQWLADDYIKNSVLLLDVREDEEFKISHIEDSIHVQPSTQDFKEIIDAIKSRQIKKVVTYCSIGYRSSLLAKLIYSELKTIEPDLLKNIEIYNLEGSIFKWANENKGHIVDNSGEICNFVHPYNMVWSKFLDYDKRKWPS